MSRHAIPGSRTRRTVYRRNAVQLTQSCSCRTVVPAVCLRQLNVTGDGQERSVTCRSATGNLVECQTMQTLFMSADITWTWTNVIIHHLRRSGLSTRRSRCFSSAPNTMSGAGSWHSRSPTKSCTRDPIPAYRQIHRRLADGTVHCAGSATYQICFRLPIPTPNPNPITDPNPNPNPKIKQKQTKRHRNEIQHRVISKS